MTVLQHSVNHIAWHHIYNKFIGELTEQYALHSIKPILRFASKLFFDADGKSRFSDHAADRSCFVTGKKNVTLYKKTPLCSTLRIHLAARTSTSALKEPRISLKVFRFMLR